MRIGARLSLWFRKSTLLTHIIRRIEVLRNEARIDTTHSFHNTIQINPLEIENKLTTYFHFINKTNAVIGGDWDKYTTPFTDSKTYRGLVQHFVDGIPWEDTEYFKFVLTNIKQGNYFFNCTNEQELRARCTQIDTLYTSIKKHGVRVSGGDPAYGIYDSITINIDRDGRYIFNNGNHRLTIARILGLTAIPVRILVRHAKWYTRLQSDTPTDHPDYLLNHYANPSSIKS